MKDGGTGFLSDKRLERFSGRIAATLEDRPFDLPPDEHRERIGELLAGLGERNFFDLLDVDPMAEEAEVHRAYTELARLVHPSHAEALAVKGGAPALEVIFERATEAYLTLSDPDLRARYRQRLESMGWRPEAPTGIARDEEKRREARREFLIAERLVADGRFHDAVQLLEQTVRMDREPRYLALLGHCLGRNPHWTQEAINCYVEAVQAEPHVVDYRRELGLLFERAGAPVRAREHLQAALELDPTDDTIIEALERLPVARSGAAEQERSSLWRKLTGWMGGED
ncbi:MAG: DnaJ domain-containing protein [Thermoanaerobaculia bacterium]